eukprot:TRINITY_DN16107_c0_g1_i2.p1 TRINITY_DN16107_c0_g1~~TRINITY_DN16107_c0_g1_i2.p1  ORF type:complete len:134 (-),score=23.25 TRINITY_DN16107_c0_g1_i2:60-461(-)
MRLLIFSLFMLTASYAVTRKSFRFKNGTGGLGKTKFLNIEGSIVYTSFSDPETSFVYFSGMVMDTITPIQLQTTTRYEMGESFDLEYDCKELQFGRRKQIMMGTLRLKGTWERAEFKGQCVTCLLYTSPSPRD